MASSVGGFTAPSAITHFCLRTPEEVSLSKDGREFSPLALFSPLLSLCVLVASYMSGEPPKSGQDVKVADTTAELVDEEKPSETTPLTKKDLQTRQRSDGEETFVPQKLKLDRPRRRRSLMEQARGASMRGSMLDGVCEGYLTSMATDSEM